MQQDPIITLEQLVKKTRLSRRGVEWNIDSFKKRGTIKRVSSKKTGKWVVNTVD